LRESVSHPTGSKGSLRLRFAVRPNGLQSIWSQVLGQQGCKVFERVSFLAHNANGLEFGNTHTELIECVIQLSEVMGLQPQIHPTNAESNIDETSITRCLEARFHRYFGNAVKRESEVGNDRGATS
jgi:hypothetical protein